MYCDLMGCSAHRRDGPGQDSPVRQTWMSAISCRAASDGGEGGAGMRPWGVFVVQHRDPAAGARSGWRAAAAGIPPERV